MRQLILIFLFLTSILSACDKTNSSSVVQKATVPVGIYTGTFQRQTSTGGQISNVTITFSDSTWTGQSQFVKYPALCHGIYKIIGTDSVTFMNECVWTAEFDGTLILGGGYKMKTVGNSIEIIRDYNGVFKDIYKLTKQ